MEKGFYTALGTPLDENGNFTGRTALRGRNFFKRGEYHLVVHIWIVSPDGKVLIQRRTDNRKSMPGEWAATGGAAVSGEDSFTAAKRELFEELSIASDEDSLKLAFTLKRRNSFLDAWFISFGAPAELLTLQKEEVAEAKWVTAEQLKDMIAKGKYHNYGKEYFDRVFENIKNYTKSTTVV